MEKNLNQNESKLFDLIESTDYFNLSNEDKKFVASQISEEEYQLQRRILSDSSNLFENEEIKPLPLMIPIEQKSKRVKTIPLYQAILAVASVCILFLLFWPINNKIMNQGNEFVAASKPKDIIQKENIHDTIVQYIHDVKVIEKIVIDTVREYITETNFTIPDNRLLEATNSISIPVLKKEDIITKGVSLKDDQSSRFIIPMYNSN